MNFFHQSLTYIVYPPSVFAIEGYWMRLGAIFYNIPLNYRIPFNDFTNHIKLFYDGGSTSVTFGILPIWGMLPILIALFILVFICYSTLKNKILALLCFGPFTFVSIILMGQLDIFCILLIFISLSFMLKSLNDDNYLLYLLLSFLALGGSIEFKTYGALLLPPFLVYTYVNLKNRNLQPVKHFAILLASVGCFLISTFVIWLPYGFSAFQSTIMSGESNWLFAYQLSNGLSLWLLGYIVLLFYIYHLISNNETRFLSEEKYYHFFNFILIVWFFVSVPTYPQWWLLLVPVTMFVMDSINLRINYFYCITACIFYWIFVNSWDMTFVTSFAYFEGSFISSLSVLNSNEHAISLTILLGILIMWIFTLHLNLGTGSATRESNN